MNMIESRNLTSHTYNEETAQKVVAAILGSYYAEFAAFEVQMEKLKEEEGV